MSELRVVHPSRMCLSSESLFPSFLPSLLLIAMLLCALHPSLQSVSSPRAYTTPSRPARQRPSLTRAASLATVRESERRLIHGWMCDAQSPYTISRMAWGRSSHCTPLPLAFYLRLLLRPGSGNVRLYYNTTPTSRAACSPLPSPSRRSRSWNRAMAAAAGEPSTPKMRATRMPACAPVHIAAPVYTRVRARVRVRACVMRIF
ncbi:hypothetical protein B0H11DRAFT_2308648 [Mycena galericulata]|nr:hypothetical protein B0H11DRAFT_2308648 [Mycena galericulata]